MDNNRFDNLTRLFGSGLNRRQVIRGLIGGTGAVAVGSVLRPDNIGAQQCRTPGEVCQNNPGQGNNCCAGLTCDDEGTGNGTCSGCPTGQYYCLSALSCIPNEACCADSDCTKPDDCTVVGCVNGSCEIIEGGCPAGEFCCPAQGGSCAECCDSGDCPVDEPICYNPGDPTNAFCVECVNSGDCGTCQECEGNWCVDLDNCCTVDADCLEPCDYCLNGTCTPFAEYCPEGDYCYNTNIGECCTDEDCGDEVCVDGHCCPPGYEYCPDGDFCYTDRQGECCIDDECETACVDHHCVECPEDELWCERTQSCYHPSHQCCADDECVACNTCDDENQCTEINCCYDNDDCYSDEVCCSGYCVAEEIGCCREFGDYCGVLDVSSAEGDDRQYDCCDGLLCCFGQSTNVCGECCADSDCTDAKGGVCNDFICEYPTCDGKGEVCKHDDECCGKLVCHHGTCKKPHKPHPKPTPKPPAPEEPVTTLPATGSGDSQSGSSVAVGATLAAGAAAVIAARLRNQNREETAE